LKQNNSSIELTKTTIHGTISIIKFKTVKILKLIGNIYLAKN